jgi:hypothetical protein
VKHARFLPEVHDDLLTTMDWLDTRRAGLGSEFESEFFSAVELVRTRPQAFASDHTGYRPCRLQRFSAVMYFSIENETIVVAGVFMGGRSESNLKNRG